LVGALRTIAGITYENEIKFKRFSILIAPLSTLFLLHPGESLDLKLWLAINRAMGLVLNEPSLTFKIAFGLFLDEAFSIRKKKIRRSFLESVQADNFIFLLEGSNEDSYYHNNHKTESFVGVELRFEDMGGGGVGLSLKDELFNS